MMKNDNALVEKQNEKWKKEKLERYGNICRGMLLMVWNVEKRFQLEAESK